MKKINVIEANDFSDTSFKRLLVHDSPYFKILNFNFKAGQQLPVHAHDIEGQVSMVILAAGALLVTGIGLGRALRARPRAG